MVCGNAKLCLNSPASFVSSSSALSIDFAAMARDGRGRQPRVDVIWRQHVSNAMRNRLEEEGVCFSQCSLGAREYSDEGLAMAVSEMHKIALKLDNIWFGGAGVRPTVPYGHHHQDAVKKLCEALYEDRRYAQSQ